MTLRKSLPVMFGFLLLTRLLYPFFDSPLDHLFSDPARHWDNGAHFLAPSILGSSDPFLYQLWIFALRTLTRGSAPGIDLGCGILCAAMPYGWYRALRELTHRERAFAGAIVIALIPESLGLYAYFMNETLLLSVLPFCFWLTLRANRVRTTAGFAVAAACWIAAALTRTLAVPLALSCIAWLWSRHGQRPRNALIAVLLVAVGIVPAGLHGAARLGYFAPFGNLYLNAIYRESGRREIAIDYGPAGHYGFGCPSFFNPSFYPWSAWTTARTGVVSIAIDLGQGRAAWLAEQRRIRALRATIEPFPDWRDWTENLVFLLFGQTWPNSDRDTWVGTLTLWSRWLWAPMIAVVAATLIKHRYRGSATLLPLCAIGTFCLLVFQGEGVMEARYREPLDAMLIASLFVMTSRRLLPPTG